MNDNSQNSNIIPPHGGYRDLVAYQMAEIAYDATVVFCDKFISKFSRTRDQMIQAARSGKQNIAEGSMVSGTSKKSELKLMGVARASLEELLQDYLDFLRQNGFNVWAKDDPRSLQIRKLGYMANKSYLTYKTYIENYSGETAANTTVCIIHQTNYLLDQLIRRLDKDFKSNGGITERLYQARKNIKK